MKRKSLGRALHPDKYRRGQYSDDHRRKIELAYGLVQDASARLLNMMEHVS